MDRMKRDEMMSTRFARSAAIPFVCMQNWDWRGGRLGWSHCFAVWDRRTDGRLFVFLFVTRTRIFELSWTPFHTHLVRVESNLCK